jgi:hypothetical protein
MKKRCLPTCLIVRNVCLTLLLIGSTVVVAADIHASANQQQEKTEALRRLFVMQVMVNAEEQP